MQGSPPHGRGKELFNLLHVLRHRITPAWAGKSDSPPVCGWVWEDHPRVGGEKSSPAQAILLVRGSPPRKRGKVHDFDQIGRSAGITPAWAGKRPSQGKRPRVGGEKCRTCSNCALLTGSPPRRRGKAKRQAGLLFPAGITPAWAGKSLWTKAISTRTLDHPRVGGEKCRE